MKKVSDTEIDPADMLRRANQRGLRSLDWIFDVALTVSVLGFLVMLVSLVVLLVVGTSP